MKLFRTSFFICIQNFRKWTTDYRIWILGIIICILIHSYWSDMEIISNSIGIKPSQWIFPFLYSQFYMKLIFTLPLILIFCDAPFTDSNQIFVIMRSGRKSWALGQILYIFMTSAVYYIFIFAATLFFSLSCSDWSMEWGKVINTIAHTNIAQNNGAFFVEASSLITTFFSPVQAVWFTFLLSTLSAAVLGLIIFFVNITTNAKSIGMAVSASLAVLSFMVANGDLDYLLKFSPMSWNTLNNVDVGGKTFNPSFEYCIAVYLGFIFILTILIMIKIRKTPIEVCNK